MRCLLLCISFFFGQMASLHAKEAPVVYLYNWADYIPQEVLDQFEAETGIHPVYDVFDNAETLEAKLFLRSGYDVVFPAAWPLFARGIEADLFLPLDPELLPNADALDPVLLEKLATIDPQHRYGVPYLWGTTGIGYDTEQVLAFAPDAPLDSWALFFDPAVIARLGPCRPQLLDGAADVFQAALLYLGYSPSTTNKEEWQEAIDVVARVRPFIDTFDNGRQIEALVQEQSYLIQGFSTYINMARKQAEPQKRTLRYIIPKEGAVVWIDMMAVPRSAPHPINAHVFINFILRPDIMARISNSIRVANPIPSSYNDVDKVLLDDPMIFPDAETMKRIYPDVSLPLSLQRWISRAWLKIKMRHNIP